MVRHSALLAVLLCTLNTASWAATTSQADHGIERYYCTQFGPFFLRFDPDKAAGVFSIFGNGDMGAIVGHLNDQNLDGKWIENDNQGSIKIQFSEDWSRLDASYTIAEAPNEWRHGWTGFLKPDEHVTSFDKDGLTLQCKRT